jgi:hypothetical protein
MSRPAKPPALRRFSFQIDRELWEALTRERARLLVERRGLTIPTGSLIREVLYRGAVAAAAGQKTPAHRVFGA